MEPYLDTIKSLFYLFLALGISWFFWNSAEKYARKGLQFVDPLSFFIMSIWGASGFFFLSPILHFVPSLFQPILQLYFKPLPDWDIYLYIWANSYFSNIEWEILKHRSWLFSSVLLPILLIIISLLLRILYKPIRTKYHYIINSILIGLSIGVSAHLSGDILLSFIPRGDIGFKIYGWNLLSSFIWFISHIFLGFSIPFFLIWLISVISKKKYTE